MADFKDLLFRFICSCPGSTYEVLAPLKRQASMCPDGRPLHLGSHSTEDDAEVNRRWTSFLRKVASATKLPDTYVENLLAEVLNRPFLALQDLKAQLSRLYEDNGDISSLLFEMMHKLDSSIRSTDAFWKFSGLDIDVKNVRSALDYLSARNMPKAYRNDTRWKYLIGLKSRSRLRYLELEYRAGQVQAVARIMRSLEKIENSRAAESKHKELLKSAQEQSLDPQRDHIDKIVSDAVREVHRAERVPPTYNPEDYNTYVTPRWMRPPWWPRVK